MGFEGSWFTWERGSLPKTNIQERLDRGVANTDWITLFPEVKVQHLVHLFSNHCPLLINTGRYEEQLGNNNFKFEAWWSLEESFINEVKSLWEQPSRELLQKLENWKKRIEEVGWANSNK